MDNIENNIDSIIITKRTLERVLDKINTFKNEHLYVSMQNIYMRGIKLKSILNVDNIDDVDDIAFITMCKGYAILDELCGQEFKTRAELETAFNTSKQNDGLAIHNFETFSKLTDYIL